MNTQKNCAERTAKVIAAAEPKGFNPLPVISAVIVIFIAASLAAMAASRLV